MKKLVVMMLAVVMSVSLAACGGSKDNGDGSNAGTENNAAGNNTGNGTAEMKQPGMRQKVFLAMCLWQI